MSRSHLSVRDRRALVLGTALMGALVLGARVLPTLHRWSAAQHQAARQAEGALQEAEETIARRPSTAGSVTRVAELLAPFDSALLAGMNVPSAGTALSDAVSAAAEASGATLGSVQLRRDSLVRGAVTHVSASATISGDIEAVALFLETLEAGPLLLAVRQLSISGGGGATATVEQLRVEVLVEGMFAPRTGASK